MAADPNLFEYEVIHAQLEDVANGGYWLKHDRLPYVETPVVLEWRKRSAIVTLCGLVVGYLPPRFDATARSADGTVTFRGHVTKVSVAEAIVTVWLARE